MYMITTFSVAGKAWPNDPIIIGYNILQQWYCASNVVYLLVPCGVSLHVCNLIILTFFFGGGEVQISRITMDGSSPHWSQLGDLDSWQVQCIVKCTGGDLKFRNMSNLYCQSMCLMLVLKNIHFRKVKNHSLTGSLVECATQGQILLPQLLGSIERSRRWWLF